MTLNVLFGLAAMFRSKVRICCKTSFCVLCNNDICNFLSRVQRKERLHRRAECDCVTIPEVCCSFPHPPRQLSSRTPCRRRGARRPWGHRRVSSASRPARGRSPSTTASASPTTSASRAPSFARSNPNHLRNISPGIPTASPDLALFGLKVKFPVVLLRNSR